MGIHSFSRREFGRMGLAGATCMAFSKAAVAAEESGWIDAHVHVWTNDFDKYPINTDFKSGDMDPVSFTPDQLFVHTRPAGVSRIVLIQMSYYKYDNSYMLDMIAQYPEVFCGIAIVDHQAAGLVPHIKSLADRGVRGFRIHATGKEARSWLNDAGMQTLWQTASEEGLAVCPLINPSDLPVIDTLCEKYPKTTVVVDHFARIGISGSMPSEELASLCRLARFPNTYVKASAYYALGAKTPPYQDLLPMIQRVIHAFGADRVMWASDCPFQVQGIHRYDQSINLIHDAPENVLSSETKRSLLRGTAEKLFFGGDKSR